MWEKAKSKQCLLDFLLALDGHYPCIADEHAALRTDPAAQKEWLQLIFEPEHFHVSAVEDAAVAVFAGNSNWGIELIAAALSRSNAFKTAIKIDKCEYNGGRPVPDCVEVSVDSLVKAPPDGGNFCRLFYAKSLTCCCSTLLPCASAPIACRPLPLVHCCHTTRNYPTASPCVTSSTCATCHILARFSLTPAARSCATAP